MKKISDFIEQQLLLWFLAAFTLGLAPFTPEPHIAGKLRWIVGGAQGMKTIDWLDTFLHGTPWILLLLALLLKLWRMVTKRSS